MAKILIVDDNEQNLYFLEVLLKGNGYEVMTAPNGSEALAMARATPPDLIISDILMPVMDGFSLCRMWKSDERLRQIPFIFYTATYTDEKDKQLALDLGADRFLLKPQEMDALVPSVAELIGKKYRVEASQMVPPGEEMEFFRQHNEVLLNKLEKKMSDLEAANEELKKKEEELRKTAERYRSIFENAVEGIFQATPDGRSIDVNPAMVRLYGYESASAMTSEIVNAEKTRFVEPQDRARLMEEYAKHGYVERFETRIRRKNDGSIIWITINGRIARDAEGNVLYYEGTAFDITKQKVAEAQIEASLREKEVLLKEIHHRVKNNLQVMSSLLNMQSQHVDDPKAMEALKLCVDRIRSMALIHDKLYRSESLSDIYFPTYIGDLAHDLIGVYAPGKGVVLSLDVDPVAFGIETSMPLGLIVNELVTNSLRHGFPGEEGGIITIALNMDGAKGTLVVSDTGAGFPEGIDFRTTRTMGMQLVVILVEQLDGTMELRRGKGTEFRIVFEAQD